MSNIKHVPVIIKDSSNDLMAITYNIQYQILEFIVFHLDD